MGTQEGCRDGTVGDAPSGRDAAWGVLLVVGTFNLNENRCGILLKQYV